MEKNNRVYYLLPVKDLVVFPKSITSISIGRPKSLALVEEVHKTGELIFVALQKNSTNDNITGDNISKVGVLCKVLQQSETQNKQKRIVVEGVARARIAELHEDEKSYLVKVEEIPEQKLTLKQEEQIQHLKKLLFAKLKQYLELLGKFNEDIFITFDFFKSVNEIIFYSAAIVPISNEKKQEILEENGELNRFKKFIEFIDVELSLVKMDKKINSEVEKKFLKTQKKMYLNEKIKVIKKELADDYDDSDDTGEIAALRKRIAKTKLSDEARQKCKEELKKMEGMTQYSAEYHVLKNYIELVLSLPWGTKSKVDNDLKKAEKILNRDHYGLKEVKERILEFLAVYKRKNTLGSQIICLVGAPGVGKTSLAKSIAESLNRKYIKVSLGGIRDEAEIRGHRKTYVGSMPGRIISSLKKAGTSNPLILLDEIDKLGMDYRGDPANALLEVLDPEQNKKFEDHYLEVEFDLSDVMFITTANNISGIPIPLRDRMEIIRISGYTEDEKLNIAKQHLIPKELDQHGLKPKEISIDDNVILQIIRKYTFEAGVRNLERELAQIIRKATKKIIVNPKTKKVSITTRNLKDYLGVEKFDYNTAAKDDKVGVAVGLAYTDFGGDLLNIEIPKILRQRQTHNYWKARRCHEGIRPSSIQLRPLRSRPVQHKGKGIQQI